MLSRLNNSLQRRIKVISAICNREDSITIRRLNIGAFSYLLEPVLVVLSLVLLRLFFKVLRDIYLNPFIWLTIGVVVFSVFKLISLLAITGVKRYQRVLIHRTISILDCFLGRSIAYFRSYLMILLIIFLSTSIYEQKLQLEKPLLALYILVLLFMLCVGFGLLTFIIGSFYPQTQLFIRFFIRRILFWTSGIFAPLYVLPPSIYKYFTWNPLLHASELLRHSINSAYPLPLGYISVEYITIISIFSIILSSTLYLISHKELEYLQAMSINFNES